MNIRPAITADLEALNNLMRNSSAYQGDYWAILEDYQLSNSQLDVGHFNLAERAGDVLGFYRLITHPEPELDLMFVADSAQGKGIGKKLFGHMLNLSRQLDLKTVKIVSHPPAGGFYLRMGAYEVGSQPPAGRVTWTRPILEINTQILPK